MSGLPLAYNQQLFAQAGLTEPPAAWNDPGWTWEPFVTALRKLTFHGPDGTVSQWGFSYYTDWLSLPYNWGGDYIDPTLRRFTGSDEKLLESWQAVQDLAWVHQVMPKPGSPSANFFFGQTAMAAVGTWNNQQLLTSEHPLKLAPWFKVGSTRPAGVMYPVGFALLTSARNKENAWELIKFATLDPEGNYLWSVAAGALPGVTKAHRRWMDSLQRQKDINLATFIQQAAEYGAVINVRKATEFNQISGILGAAFESVLANRKSPRQVMQEIGPQVQALISQGTQ